MTLTFKSTGKPATAQRKSKSGSNLLPIVAIFAFLAFFLPRANAMVRGWMAPITVAEDVQEINTDVYLFSVGFGYPKPSPETVASNFQTSKVSPWGYQYNLVAGGRNTLWICVGIIPEEHKGEVQSMFREQRRPTAEQEDLFYVMCSNI